MQVLAEVRAGRGDAVTVWLAVGFVSVAVSLGYSSAYGAVNEQADMSRGKRIRILYFIVSPLVS